MEQDKKIEEQITHKNLIKEKKQNIKHVTTAERDMELFFKNLFLMDALPAGFILGLSFIILSF